MRPQKNSWMCVMIASFVGGAFGSALQAQESDPACPEYRIMNLGTLPGTMGSRSLGINKPTSGAISLGQVVGQCTDAGGNTRAFIWLPQPVFGFQAEQLHDLDALAGGAGDSVAHDINVRSQIVGQAVFVDDFVAIIHDQRIRQREGGHLRFVIVGCRLSASRGHSAGVLWFENPDWVIHEIDPDIRQPHSLTVADLDCLLESVFG